MINMSKILAVTSLLLFGINNSFNTDDRDLDEFYYLQKNVALCKPGYSCKYKDDYLSFFPSDAKICIPKEEYEYFANEDIVCYTKHGYEKVLNNGLYKDIKEIIKWEHEIISIDIIQDKYGNDQQFVIKVKVDKEYIKEDCCQYKTIETEKFAVTDAGETSYEVINIHIKSKECRDDKDKTNKPTTSGWMKPETSKPTPGKHTTAKPTTSWMKPETAKPTWPTAKPTAAWPTYKPTAKPTPKPTRAPAKPFIPKTKSPTKMWQTSPTKKKCNYNGHKSHNEYEYETECDYGYKCVKEDEYKECGYNAYCPGICIKQ